MLGGRLVHDSATGRRSGRIVEVEAYIGEDDQASHARFGRTARNAVMYGPAGIAYVYLVYGMYDCLNIVTEVAGRPAAVLIRAVEPIEGLDAMRTGRDGLRAARTRRPPAARARPTPDHRLASGPGLVAAAFGITRADTGRDLADPASPLRLEAVADDESPPRVVGGARIGVAYAGEPWASLPWRFTIADHPSVSGPVRRR